MDNVGFVVFGIVVVAEVVDVVAEVVGVVVFDVDVVGETSLSDVDDECAAELAGPGGSIEHQSVSQSPLSHSQVLTLTVITAPASARSVFNVFFISLFYIWK